MRNGARSGRRLRGFQARGLPALQPPEALGACRLATKGLEFAVLEWPVQARPPHWGRLTRAEREVVQLALAGLSNEAIALRRGSALRTVANQLASAYARLGVGSRAELAAWAAQGREER